MTGAAATQLGGGEAVVAKLPAGAQAAYGAGQIAGQVFRDVPSLLLLFFMTNVLGISPALAGISIFVPKLIWGMACDVSVGVLSDRLQNWMARKYWLIIGAMFVPVAMLLLFHVPVMSTGHRALYVAGVFSLYMAVFATFSVPYLAITGELSSDPNQRTIIMAWRLVFTAIGVLIADSLAPIFLQSQGGGQIAYEHTALILSAVSSLSLLIAFFGAGAVIRRAPPIELVENPVRLTLQGALAALAERRFSMLLLSNLSLLVGGGMAYASMLYFLTYNLHRADAFTQIGYITIIACATIIGAQPGWVYLARRLGKKPVFIAAALFYGLVTTLWSVFGPLGMDVCYGFAFLLGISNSGWTLLGYSMLADITGEGRAGLYSAVWIAADKIGFALGGTLLVGLLLGAFGFNATHAMQGLPQPASALTGVRLAFGIAPGCFSLLAAIGFALWGRSDATPSARA